GSEGHRPHRAAVSHEGTCDGVWLSCLSLLHLPQANSSIEAATGKPAPIRAPGQRIDRAALVEERLEGLARADLPESDDPIISATGECPAIGTKGETMDAACMLSQPEQGYLSPRQGSVLQVPQLDGAVPAPGGEHLLIWPEGERLHRRGMRL